MVHTNVHNANRQVRFVIITSSGWQGWTYEHNGEETYDVLVKGWTTLSWWYVPPPNWYMIAVGVCTCGNTH